MFVVVHNNSDFNVDPYWYFTSDELRHYMPLAVRKCWDTADVEVKLEAFALAGCDSMTPQKAAHAKGEIRDRINAKLVDITGNPNTQMAYVNYEEDIVHKYGVEMVGWTPDKWCNPSDLSSSLPLLHTLLNAIKADTCMFGWIAPATLCTRKEKYDADIAAGRIIGKQRNHRSDIDFQFGRTFISAFE
ncbi:hypothetical protein B0H14DRAFT_2652099 [Mycena olivaceomarginata]|nr:hypothetical protein B0H14DRAFT_2652099 [Mycena olivaceomarginata]